jgi:polysaccharide export outer membrane protein
LLPGDTDKICDQEVAGNFTGLFQRGVSSVISSWSRRLASLAIIVLFACNVAAQDAPPVQDAPVDYVIGPGDQLQVYVWRNPELSKSVPVRPDGKISTPLVEDMIAIGKSPSQLARDIERVLAEYVREPKVNVIVEQAASTFSEVKVVGQVQKPQSMPYRQGLKVLDIVLQSGGLTDFAAGNRARILRDVNGKKTEIKVRLGDLVNDGDMRQNHELRPGDVLIVPQSRF